MPAWIPAIEREKPIACKYVLPIVFKEANLEEMEIISAVEKMPEYIGGTEAMYVFIHTHLEYPQEAKDAGVEGRVFVSFWVDVDGSLKGIEVMKGIGYGCDEAAMAVMRKMPLWKPGEQRGKPIKVRYTVPIQFKLSDTDQRK